MPTVEDVLMTNGPEVLIATEDTLVSAAAKMMADANCGSLIIMDENQQIQGIFTERDLLKKVVAKGINPAEATLGNSMSSPVVTCSLNDNIEGCWEEMSKRRIRHIAVVEQGALVGVIGLRDILSQRKACLHPEGRLCTHFESKTGACESGCA